MKSQKIIRNWCCACGFCFTPAQRANAVAANLSGKCSEYGSGSNMHVDGSQWISSLGEYNPCCPFTNHHRMFSVLEQNNFFDTSTMTTCASINTIFSVLAYQEYSHPSLLITENQLNFKPSKTTYFLFQSTATLTKILNVLRNTDLWMNCTIHIIFIKPQKKATCH